MHPVNPFVTLPIAIHAAAPDAEIAAGPEEAWQPHPEGTGDSALPDVVRPTS